MNEPRIKIYTRSMNSILYRKSMSFINLPYPKVRITGSSALGYLLWMVNDDEADIVINIDEDAFVTDNAVLEGLLDHFILRGYTNCGMPDGGIVEIRQHHPLVTNPFFTIMNTAAIRAKLETETFSGFPLGGDNFLAAHPRQLLRKAYSLDAFEPYNEFFVWIARNFQTLYLDADTHSDGISTVLKDHLDRAFLIHTWYSRSYGRDLEGTRRIHTAIDSAHALNAYGSAVSNADRVRAIGSCAYLSTKVHLSHGVSAMRRILRREG